MVNLSRLAKVWKLTTSPNPGEAAAARERARVIVAREGKTLADVPNLLRGQATAAAAGPKPGPSGFTFYNMNNSAQWAAYAERDRQRRADQARQEAPERAEVVARYGSVEAALAWTEPEKLLRAAVSQWSVSTQHRTIDGLRALTGTITSKPCQRHQHV